MCPSPANEVGPAVVGGRPPPGEPKASPKNSVCSVGGGLLLPGTVGVPGRREAAPSHSAPTLRREPCRTAPYFSFGEGSSRFEAGIGLALMAGGIDNVEGFEDEGFSGATGTAALGYRYQRPGGGFVFRVGLTPLFGPGGILPWGGLSLGYSF